jgi:hypothetical protein
LELHRLPADAAMHASAADRGWARALSRTRVRTLQEILDDARAEMDAQDAAEERARDPFTYVGAHRRRSTLWARLLGR